MAREFHIKTVTSTESIADLHVTVTTTFQDLLLDFTYTELLESESLYALLSDSNIVAEDENGITISSFGDMQPPGSSSSSIEECNFGAKSDSVGKLLIANGKSTEPDDSTKTKTRHPIAYAGNLVALAYQTKDGQTTTQMKIRVNGSAVRTVVLTNLSGTAKSGVETFSPYAVLPGDTVEVEYDATPKPGECIMKVINERT